MKYLILFLILFSSPLLADQNSIPLPPLPDLTDSIIVPNTSEQNNSGFGLGINVGYQSFNSSQFEGPQIQANEESVLSQSGGHSINGSNLYSPSSASIEVEGFSRISYYKVGFGYRFIGLGQEQTSASGSNNGVTANINDTINAYDNNIFTFLEADWPIYNRLNFILRTECGVDLMEIYENQTLTNTNGVYDYINTNYLGAGNIIAINFETGFNFPISGMFTCSLMVGYHYSDIKDFQIQSIQSNINSGEYDGETVLNESGNDLEVIFSGINTNIGINYSF